MTNRRVHRKHNTAMTLITTYSGMFPLFND